MNIVMGLSSYGKPVEHELSQVMFNTKMGYKLNLDYFVIKINQLLKMTKMVSLNIKIYIQKN